jgi:NAD(P)-dependent dehydrogenase (short-subunit alcohol dehydrogenase family)
MSNEAAAQETWRRSARPARKALAVKADVASREDTRGLFAEAKKAFGRLDAVVNNAGVVGGLRSIFDADEEHLRGVFDANVLGCFYCAGEGAKAMSTQKGGSGGTIVNVSSAASRTGGMPQEAHYAASKGAVDSLTLALAKELAPHGIRVNAVRPASSTPRSTKPTAGRPRWPSWRPRCRWRAWARSTKWPRWSPSCAVRSSSYMHGALVDVSGGR